MGIRRLHVREQPESLPNEVRPRSQAAIRCLYLSSIALLALWLADMFVGGFFYLRSEGQVLAEPAVVAVEFPVTVQAVTVGEGDRVTAGQIVAVVASQNVTESLANLSVALADQVIRLAELQIRNATVNAVIALAQTRQSVAIDTRRKYESLLATGFLPLDKRSVAVENEFRSKEDLARLTAERSTLTGQIADLTQAVAQANDAVGRLRSLFDGGRVRAPIDGIVGRRVADNGAVLQPGQPLLVLYQDARFVAAYLPTGGLFSVAPGDRVVVSTGLQSFTGAVTRIEPVAAVPPGEFRGAFAPTDRRQLFRIAFDPGQSPPPLFAKVRVRSASWRWVDRLEQFFGRRI
jgi:multidrug resistance efflux pump